MTPIGTLLLTLRENDNILFCDGRELPINEYKEFADFCIKQYGKANYFGGDGIKSIGLPDIQGWSIVVRNIEDKKEPCENWYDVPSDEMTLEQARQAVKDLRKKVAECLEQEPCEDAISRQAAVEAFQMFREYESNRSNKGWVDRIETVLNQLPPVNPQTKTIQEKGE